MVVITLPDGQKKSFPEAVTVKAIAESIGSGLAKAAIAGRIGSQCVDLSHKISEDAQLHLITAKSPEALDIIRHSSAHLMAQAVKRCFPRAQVVIGPVIEDGFYYDFSFERSFTTDDFAVIEAAMQRIVKERLVVSREVMSRDEARALFASMGEDYKVRILDDIPSDELISCYRQGEFIDLCRGPHVAHTGQLKAVKLTKVSGSYWRGDSQNATLQRIYGTAWSDKEALNEYLKRLEEAEKRDHRKLGKQLHLFHLQEEAPGMVFWHERGWTLYRLLENYIRHKLQKAGYQEIKTPQLADRKLWERSGHWEKFGDEMFVTETENRTYAIKPMNCPCHVQVFNQGVTSYRDLPVRLAEFGSCHRREPSGTLHGLMRLRNFVQDDAHIFCSDEQLMQEVEDCIKLLFEIYHDFGFTEVITKLSTRPSERVGSDQTWDKAEKSLADALDNHGLDWTESPGEGAFYGPKIEFTLKDCLNRLWQCGTVQVDFSMPERLSAHYVAADGSKQTPVMIHRAIFGSVERFIGILIENYAGHFPVWMAPKQAVVLNITDHHADYARQIADKLQQKGLRVVLDLRNEKIGFKIREHTLQRVPYHLVVGDREVASGGVSVRACDGNDLGSMPVDQFAQMVHDACGDLKHFTD